MELASQALKQRMACAIERRRDDIIQRWLARVSVEVGVSGIPLTELRNALPDYLISLRDELMREGDLLTLDQSGTAAWRRLCREHAITRVRLGFDIGQLAREFIALRRVLHEVAVEEAVLESAEPPILAELLEAGVAEALHTYVQARDYAARRAQAEHVGFVTHELRNPLNAAKLATAQLRHSANPQQVRLLDILERSQNRMAELVDSVLAAEKLEAKQLASKPELVRLQDVLGETLSVGKREAEAKGLNFRASYDPGLMFRLDPVLTRAAVQNLLENAVKYTDEGLVELSFEDRPREMAIHIRDTCHGISSEDLDTIFEPFSRGHSRKPGTGLGLAIARRSIEAQGGRIQAESPGDRGCHFWFTLPKQSR
jgi:signal transduction histidine kinase